MQNYWNLDLQCKRRQLTGPVNYRDFRETGPRKIDDDDVDDDSEYYDNVGDRDDDDDNFDYDNDDDRYDNDDNNDDKNDDNNKDINKSHLMLFTQVS